MRNLRKKLWILLVIATAFSISACGMRADVSEQVSEQTPDVRMQTIRGRIRRIHR